MTRETAQRISSIDLLRGIAVLGILIMNIQSFTMPGSAYINPTAYGDLSGINKWVWILSHLFADTKFMSLFSILFGAGIILLTDKLKATQRPVRKIWYSRIIWLFIFGFLHMLLIWAGDILMMYAICGFYAFLFKNRTTKFLIRLAIILFIIPISIEAFQGSSWSYFPDEAKDQVLAAWSPSDEKISEQVEYINAASYSQSISYRIEDYLGLFFYHFVPEGFWRILSMMLFGMYFYKRGIITASKEAGFYKKWIMIFLPLGLLFVICGLIYNFNNQWQLPESMFYGATFNYIGSLFMAVTYMCIVMLWSQSEILSSAKELLQKVGKMAFTNYILTSLICFLFVFITNLFGGIERIYQFMMTLIVWSILLLFTQLWNKSFRMGPLEWLWRSLTYWKWAKIK